MSSGKRQKLVAHEESTTQFSSQKLRPTIRQTLVLTILMSTLAILCLGVGMGLKLTYGPSLYYPDQNTWLASFGLFLVALSIPLGVTSACLINVLCRVRSFIMYMEARKRELESKVADAYVAPIIEAKSPPEQVIS